MYFKQKQKKDIGDYIVHFSRGERRRRRCLLDMASTLLLTRSHLLRCHSLSGCVVYKTSRGRLKNRRQDGHQSTQTPHIQTLLRHHHMLYLLYAYHWLPSQADHTISVRVVGRARHRSCHIHLFRSHSSQIPTHH